jgi:hypothetical protein
MARVKTLVILTRLLGNSAFARQLIWTLDQIQEIEPVYVCVGVEDYKSRPAPRWARLTDPWESR